MSCELQLVAKSEVRTNRWFDNRFPTPEDRLQLRNRSLTERNTVLSRLPVPQSVFKSRLVCNHTGELNVGA